MEHASRLPLPPSPKGSLWCPGRQAGTHPSSPPPPPAAGRRAKSPHSSNTHLTQRASGQLPREERRAGRRRAADALRDGRLVRPRRVAESCVDYVFNECGMVSVRAAPVVPLHRWHGWEPGWPGVM